MGKEADMKDKKALRRELAERRRNIQNPAEKNRELLKNIEKLPEYREARRVFIYLSMPEEADTRELMKRALKAGKQVFAPVCDPEGNGMKFYRITAEDELKPGKYGILEPDTEKNPTAAEPGEKDLVLAPGIAFDERGYRLGYGKGYYDRYLAGKNTQTAGLCYGEMLLPLLPAEQHDQRVKTIVTEKEILRCEISAEPGKEGTI